MNDHLTVKEARGMLGMEYRTIIYHLRKGNIVGIKDGRSWAVPPESVEKFKEDFYKSPGGRWIKIAKRLRPPVRNNRNGRAIHVALPPEDVKLVEGKLTPAERGEALIKLARGKEGKDLS